MLQTSFGHPNLLKRVATLYNKYIIVESINFNLLVFITSSLYFVQQYIRLKNLCFISLNNTYYVRCSLKILLI